MNIGSLIENLENFHLSEEVFYLLGERVALLQINRAVIMVALVMGFLWCFFGLHGIRIWSAILGFVIGYLVFSRVAALFLQDDLIVLIIAVVLGLILVVINARFYLFGAFFYTFIVTGRLALFWLNPQNTMLLAVCIIVALLAAVLVLKQPNILLILVSTVVGGVVFIVHLREFVYLSDLVVVVFTVLLIILGALIQFVLLSGREKRKQLARAAEIRLQQAIASEVEKARNFLDELDDKGKGKRTSKSVKEKPEVAVTQESTEQTEQTERTKQTKQTERTKQNEQTERTKQNEQTEQEIVQRLKDELVQNLSEAQETISKSEVELKTKTEFEQELEDELKANLEFRRELEKELEVGPIPDETEEAKASEGLAGEAEKIEITTGIPEEDFAGILDLGKIERPVDERGFSEIDDVGEIDI